MFSLVLTLLSLAFLVAIRADYPTTQDICVPKGSTPTYLPKGWIVTYRGNDSCAQITTSATYYVKYQILDLNNAEIGTSANLCGGSVPDGWVPTYVDASVVCIQDQYNTNPTFLTTILKIQEPSSSA